MAGTVESVYQAYQKARQVEKEVNQQIKNVQMAGQGIGYGVKYRVFSDDESKKKVAESLKFFVSKNKAGEAIVVLYDVFAHKDAAAARKMVELLNSYMSRTPVGGLMVACYKPHFSLLFEVIGAIENTEKITKGLTELGQQVSEFKNVANRIIRATDFDRSEYQDGPFRLAAYLQTLQNTTGSPAALEAVEFTSVICKMVDQLIVDLDSLLVRYVKLCRNYERIYNDADDRLMSMQKGALSGKAIGGMVLSSIRTDYLLNTVEGGVRVRQQLQFLTENRNKWAVWAGRACITEDQYYEKPLS